MELSGGVAVDVAIEAGDSQARITRFAVVRGIEFLLRKWREEELKTIKLNGRQDVLEETIKVIDRYDLAARDVAKLRTVGQKDGRRKLGQELIRQVEIDIHPLEPRKHIDLHLGENLATIRLQWMRQRRIREEITLADVFRLHFGK